ncbi:MAG: penicillin-binding protein 1C [Xanthobacteraceae bacterium]|nr:penicillin-binding protein 1C [Xanthobacteraceae bacterium]MCW5674074.1 penicillin-binding protein 1C [Xanthobacteraceae bacterium]
MMKRLVTLTLAGALAIFAGALGAVGLIRWTAPAPHEILRSVEVVDRNGALLRPFALPDGRWRLAAKPEQVDRRYLEMLIAYEDRRFYEHIGTDPLALLRASYQLVTHGEIVSGGSTLSMQVARLLSPRKNRTIIAKLSEIVRAMQLEARLSKKQILELYLTLAPFGGNLEGVRAAAHAYFGKEPGRLTIGEAALLVALPQSPEVRRPDRAADVALRARNRVIDRMFAAGIITVAEANRARSEAVPHARREMPQLAPHAAEAAVAAFPKQHVHRLAIDATVQKRLEELAREKLSALGPRVSLAILVADNETGEVLAHVGSVDFNDMERAGRIDMTRGIRSPGSALKPFIYGMAFEDGIAHPETLIEDRPTRFGMWRPENFDLTFQGTVTTRRALQLSLNVPAVALLDGVGPQRLFARLEMAGAQLQLPQGEIPGLAIGLGGLGLRLEDLTTLFTALARGGESFPLVHRLDVKHENTRHVRLLDPVAAWYVGNVLIGAPPPDNAIFGRIAFKTGTSYGYRDAWAVGFDGKRTIAVWVGRPDGQPVPGMIGRVVAAPILFDAFARAVPKIEPLRAAPHGALIASTAKLPLTLRRFTPAGETRSVSAEPPLKIVFPLNGAQVALERDNAASPPQPIVIKTNGGNGPYRFLVDGMPVGEAEYQNTAFFQPAGPGFVRLTVIDANGATDSVVVRLQQ